MFLLYHVSKKFSLVAAFVLFTLPLAVNAQDRITTIEISEPHGTRIAFRTEDVSAKIGTTDRPYVLFGTDFRGSGGFYIAFNLETRQTVRYQLIDMMGKEIASQDLREVLDQTYRVQANSISNGAYVVRLMINHKCYSEKIFFTP
jgi:hypothetical protein